MANGDDIGSVPDERGDTLEVVLWGVVFLFTVALFVYEFGIGALHGGEGGLQPIGTITDFAQTMWLAALVGGGGVVVLIVYAIFRYGAGVRDAPNRLAAGAGTLKFTVFLLAVLVIVSTTIFVGAATLAQTDEAGPVEAAEDLGVNREVEVSVLASQWFWRFEVEGVPVDQGERVVLPADTIIQFQTTSADVIHSFSIKHLGITKDAVPGQSNTAWFYVDHVSGETELTFETANGTVSVAADTYQVRCAELCGKGHSKMLATVYIIQPEDYEIWVEANGGHAEDAFSVPDTGISIGNATAPTGDDGHGGGGH